MQGPGSILVRSLKTKSTKDQGTLFVKLGNFLFLSKFFFVSKQNRILLLCLKESSSLFREEILLLQASFLCMFSEKVKLKPSSISGRMFKSGVFEMQSNAKGDVRLSALPLSLLNLPD